MTTLVLPCGPNWAESVSEILEWRTAVLMSERGQEQRRQQRVLPRLMMEFTAQTVSESRTRLNYFIASQGRRPFYTGRFWERMLPVNPVGVADATIAVPTTSCRVLAAGMPVILVDGNDWSQTEVAFLVSWTFTSITITRPSPVAWNRRVYIYPAFVAVMDEQEASFERKGFRAAEIRLRVRALEPVDLSTLRWPLPSPPTAGGFGEDYGFNYGGIPPQPRVGSFGNFFNENFGGAISSPPLDPNLVVNGWTPWTNFFGTAHYGQPVLTQPPDYRKDRVFGTERNMTVLDSNTGLFTETDRAGVTWWTDQYVFFAQRAKELYGLLSALAYMRGQAKPFWVPTFDDDLTLQADAANGATSLVVNNYGRATLGAVASGYNHIFIRLYDGRLLTRQIGSSGVGPAPNQEMITLDTPLPFALPVSAVRNISFMRNVRSAQDLFEIDHLGPVDEAVATCSLATRSLGTTYTTPWLNSPAQQPIFG